MRPTPSGSLAADTPRPEGLVGTSWSALWRLSWPIVLTMVLNALVGLLDTWIAGTLGPSRQAAVGITMQLILLINATTTAVSIGCQALVARNVGAGEWGEAARAAQQALLLGVLLTCAVIVPVYLLAPVFFASMGATSEVQAEGAWYLRLLLLGLFPMDLSILLNAVFRATGRTKDLLASNAAETLTWMSCSLVFGWWLGFGLWGLALGFIAGRLAGLFVSWTLFRRTALFPHLVRPWRIDWGWHRRILAIGLPAGVQVLIRNIGMMAFFGILGLLAHPTEAVAAFTIGFRIESLAFLPVFALNIAAATVVGQYLGAGEPEEAARAGWRIAAAGAVLMTVFGAIFLCLAEPLARVFTQDPLVVGYAADYLRIIALSEPFLALVMVLNGAFQGAGETRVPMIMTFAAQILLRLPVAYWLAVPLGMGPVGAWWAITGSMIVQGLVVAVWFSRGSWKTRRI